MGSQDHIVNPSIISMAKQARARMLKRAFVPGGDPTMMGAPPGGDPSMMGGAPPGMDPSMMGGAPPGMDPSMMGGAPPPPPGPPPIDPAMIQQMVQQAIQQSGGGVGGGIKPKIDVNVTLMQLSKMVARIADALGVKIPAHEMIATPQDLSAMAQPSQPGSPGGDPSAGAIPPMPGMDPSGIPGQQKTGQYRHREVGSAFSSEGLNETASQASAVGMLYRARMAAR